MRKIALLHSNKGEEKKQAQGERKKIKVAANKLNRILERAFTH